ncbi:MAG: rhomboid family intramembrane serine protease [Chloroflexota bacterium]|nr:rhomboid family intramembrane serine protease [Chloroflexota bacterium]
MIPISDANRSYRFPYVNVLLILINILVYLYEVTLSDVNLSAQTRALVGFLYDWAVVPVEFTEGVDCRVAAQIICQHKGGLPPFLTLFSAMFMHGSLLHIGGNMLYLWVFGDNVESNMGHLKYLLFYLLSGILASFAHIVFNTGSAVPSLGASGAIAGVLAAYLVLYPHAQIRTLLILVIFITVTNVSALLLIGIWFLLQFFQGVTQLGANAADSGGVAVWAHVGGFIAGLVLVFLFRGPRQPDYLEDSRYRRTPRW